MTCPWKIENGLSVLGIDPGSLQTGWGIVRETSAGPRLVDCGLIRVNTKEQSFSERLAYIYHELVRVLHRLQPDEAAIEQVFTAQNATSALKLGQARGVAVAACASQGVRVHDYEPTQVKKALVGIGRADKTQVAFMLRQLLDVQEADWALDTSDALGVAVCHLSMRRLAQILPKV